MYEPARCFNVSFCKTLFHAISCDNGSDEPAQMCILNTAFSTQRDTHPSQHTMSGHYRPASEMPSMRGSRNFRRGGGGGGPGQSDKKSCGNVFFFFFSLVLSLFYRSRMVLFKEDHHFSRLLEGVQHFPGGGGSNFFQGGPIAYSL